MYAKLIPMLILVISCSLVEGVRDVRGQLRFNPDCPIDIDECASQTLNDCNDVEVCVNVPGSYQCVCVDGFSRSDGPCSDVDECKANPCDVGEFCVNQIGSFVCECQGGSFRALDGSCEDIDECESGPCAEGKSCVNVPGSFLCQCPEGFILQMDGSCSEPKDCTDVCAGVARGTVPNNPVGLAASGASFQIYPSFSTMYGLEVYCDCTDGPTGAWTVIQRRMDGSVDFVRLWTTYTVGFGDVSGEFWLGLNNIRNFTNSEAYELRVDLKDWNDITYAADYGFFDLIGPRYTLNVGGYSGDAGDGLANLNGLDFTTVDNDNDMAAANCAVEFLGAWWFRSCFSGASHLNGRYQSSNDATGVAWLVSPNGNSLQSAEMKIRPRVTEVN